MSQKTLFAKYQQSAKIGQIAQQIGIPESKTQLIGLFASATSFVIKALFEKNNTPFLVIFDDKEQAAFYLNDLEQLVGEKDVLFYPASFRNPYQIEDVENANVLLRAEVLNRINSRQKPSIIVSYPEAIFEKVMGLNI